MSEDLSELQRRLAGRRRSHFRTRTASGLVLVALASGLGLVAVPLWQHAGSWTPVASHAGSVIQANWRDLFGVPTGDDARRADQESLARSD